VAAWAEVSVREEGARAEKLPSTGSVNGFFRRFPVEVLAIERGGRPRWAVWESRVTGPSESSGKRAASMVSEGERYRCGVAGGDKRGDEKKEW
jgi:hypothetical protein